MRPTAFPLLAAALALGACAAEELLPGERIAAFPGPQAAPADAQAPADSIAVRLPPPAANPVWAQTAHGLRHPALAGTPRQRWRVQAGAPGSGALAARPVAGNGRVFVLDGRASVRAFDAETGQRLWRQSLRVTGEESNLAFGGGLALEGEKLLAATGLGSLAALNAQSGEILWRVDGAIPFRAAPAAGQGRLYAFAYNNRLSVRETGTGNEIWTHQGIPESAGLLTAPAPALAGRLAVVPYSSGEVFTLRAENGNFIWSETLVQGGIADPNTTITSVATPAIMDGAVFALSSSGRMIAAALNSGRRLWSRDFSGSAPPWSAGNAVFILTAEGRAVGLAAQSGQTIWSTALPGSGPAGQGIIWSGPVLAGGRLLFASSGGTLAALDPGTGKPGPSLKLADGFLTAPIVAQQTLYLLSSSMELIALR